MKPWFEQYPDWLETELKAFDDAGITYRHDDEALKFGKLRLFLESNLEGVGPLSLTVTYPDLYPYFRAEVQAESLALGHHQNPFQKNLCLLPRGSQHWEPSDTVASLLLSQLRKVIATGVSSTVGEAIEGEVVQAEPISVYYDFQPFSMVIVQSSWNLPPDQRFGRMTIGTQVPSTQRVHLPVRGAVLNVLDRNSRPLAQADPALVRGFGGARLLGMWARLDEPLLEARQGPFLLELMNRQPRLREAPANQVQGGFIKLFAAVFPQEIAPRTPGDGWLFVCHFEENVNRLNRDLGKLLKSPVTPVQ